MFAFGTPPARAFLMTLKSVTFFSGSTEPPSDNFLSLLSPHARGESGKGDMDKRVRDSTHDAQLSRYPASMRRVRCMRASQKGHSSLLTREARAYT